MVGCQAADYARGASLATRSTHLACRGLAYQNTLDELRGVIDRLDNEIFDLLSKRMEAAEGIGRIKRENNVIVLQSNRWSQIVERTLARSPQLRLSTEFLDTILQAIHMESIRKQMEL